MTEIEEQIKAFEACKKCESRGCYGCKYEHINIDICLAALREKFEREKGEDND